MFHYDFHAEYTSRNPDCNVSELGWSPLCGNDWSAQVKDACFSTPDRSVEKSSRIDRFMLGAALATVALLGVGMWISAPKVAQSAREVASDSVEGLTWVQFVLGADRS